jgi:prevent-host-death family protein
MHDAKTNFSKLIALVEGGEEVIVQRGDTPVAKIVPLSPAGPRTFGALRGQIEIGPGFDDIPDEFEDYLS